MQISCDSIVTYAIYYFSKFMGADVKIIIDPVNNDIKAAMHYK